MADLPDWKPLEAVEPPSGDGTGRVFGLVASEEAAAAGWSSGAALELARSWSRHGRRVVLIDAALQAPSLHEAAGVKNREGLSDAALYGVSVGKVSHPVDGFFLVTAGAPVADASSVVRSSRWHRLAQGITEAGADLLLYLRDGHAGTAAFLGSASDIVVLSGPADPAPASVGDLAPLVRAVAGSDGSRTFAPAVAGAGGGSGADSAIETGAGSAATASDAVARGGEPGDLERGSPGDASAASVGVVPNLEGAPGIGRMLMLLLGALLTAAGLGYLFTSLF